MNLKQKKLVLYKYQGSKYITLKRPETIEGIDISKIRNARSPIKHYGDKIYGILPIGSTIKIVGATETLSTTMGTAYFRVEITSDGPFKGMICSTLFIGRSWDEHPPFNPDIIEEIPIAK